MKLKQSDYLEMKVKYETGDYSIRDLSNEYGLNVSTIHDKIKRHGWIKGKTEEAKNAMVEAVAETTQNLTKALSVHEPNLPADEVELLKQYSIAQVAIRLRSQLVQDKVLETILLANENAQAFLKSHPKGIYVKSTGVKGKSFGLTTEALSPLVNALNAANNITKEQKEQTIVNNYQQTNIQQITDDSDVDPVEVYNSMIKG